MFPQVRRYRQSIYSLPRSLFNGRKFKHEINQRNLIKAFVPLLAVTMLAELVFRLTASGYSVVVILLLSVVLYNAYRRGVFIGLIGAVLIVTYNFYLVSTTLSIPFFTLRTLESGGVIAVVFPILALIIGGLKERNDGLLQKEQSARLKAEDAARQLRFMAESMPQKIFTMSPDGTSEYINPQWHEYTDPDSDGNNWAKTVHPQDYAENMELWKHSLETGEPFQFEHRLKRNDGKYIWHLTRANALRDKNGQIRMWVGSSTDIESIRRTKKLEADTARLTKQRQELMELNKAKDEFISLASHQLRTPATGVKQYLNMALDGYGGPISQRVRNLLKTADHSNERQLVVINDLLRVAQVDAGKVVLRTEPVNIDDLLVSIIRDQKSTFSKRDQKVKYNHKRRKVEVDADPTKLRMAIENVIDNASKYSPPGTTVTVRIVSGQKNVNIHIQDEGVGIAKADLAAVFQKFKRIDNPLSTVVGGTGLGLYWVKKIIELHGGEITPKSTIGKGTTFVIRLPALTHKRHHK